MHTQHPGVYMILHTASDTRYVGSAASTIRRRWAEHRSMLRNGTHRNKHLQYAWSKYGEDAFQFVLLENTTREDAVKREQHWLDLFRSQGLRLYNIAPNAGSQLGFKHTPKTRAEIAQRGKGRVFSQVTRERLSQALKGRSTPWVVKRFAKHWPPIVAPDGTVHHVYNLHQFCDEWGLSDSAIRHVILGERTDHKGWRVLRDGEQPTPFTGNLRVVGAHYRFTSPDGVSYETNNVEAFAREHGLDSKLLRDVGRGKRQHHKGWTGASEGYEPKTTNNRIPVRPRAFIAPDGTVHQVSGLGSFCRTHNLDKGAMLRVESGKQHNHKGWRKAS